MPLPLTCPACSLMASNLLPVLYVLTPPRTRALARPRPASQLRTSACELLYVRPLPPSSSRAPPPACFPPPRLLTARAFHPHCRIMLPLMLIVEGGLVVRIDTHYGRARPGGSRSPFCLRHFIHSFLLPPALPVPLSHACMRELWAWGWCRRVRPTVRFLMDIAFLRAS